MGNYSDIQEKITVLIIMSQNSADPIEGRDSQKPWESEKIPKLDENWDNAPEQSDDQNNLEDIDFVEEEPVASSVPFVDTKPQEIHDLVTLKHNMIVGTFELSQKTEILTITLEDNPYDYKVIKRQTRKIIDTCELDLAKAQM